VNKMNNMLGAIQHLESNKMEKAQAVKTSANPLKFINEIVVALYGQISDLERELAQGVQNQNPDSEVCIIHIFNMLTLP
jgi:hypothetical protein